MSILFVRFVFRVKLYGSASHPINALCSVSQSATSVSSVKNGVGGIESISMLYIGQLFDPSSLYNII